MAFPLRFPADKPLLTVTHPTPVIWVIELDNGDDSRLTSTLLRHGMRPALDAVEADWRSQRDKQLAAKDAAKDPQAGAGALIIVGKRSQDKFFSNGFDYANSSKDPGFVFNEFNPVLSRLLTFPIPTVAAINGHCFASAFITSLACDYRVMTDGAKRRAWICMNEIAFGAPWPFSFARLLRAKVGDGRVQRKIALEGHRFTPPEALAAGIVDELVPGGTEDVLKRASEIATKQAPNAKSGVWGLIKRDLYRDVVEATLTDNRAIHPAQEDALFKARL
jgi:enoyl-CoA hydratase/carnithine racemase